MTTPGTARRLEPRGWAHAATYRWVGTLAAALAGDQARRQQVMAASAIGERTQRGWG